MQLGSFEGKLCKNTENSIDCCLIDIDCAKCLHIQVTIHRRTTATAIHHFFRRQRSFLGQQGTRIHHTVYTQTVIVCFMIRKIVKNTIFYYIFFMFTQIHIYSSFTFISQCVCRVQFFTFRNSILDTEQHTDGKTVSSFFFFVFADFPHFFGIRKM